MLGIFKKSGFPLGQVCFRVEFLDLLSEFLGVLGLKQAAADTSIDAIHQLHPVVKGRFGQWVPFVIAFFALVETPVISHFFGIDLAFPAVFERAFPTDFSFGHNLILQDLTENAPPVDEVIRWR